MKPAARITDRHICPMLPAACMGDMAVCAGPTDSIILGSMTVMISNKRAARMGDMTVRGGSMGLACFTVLIGG